MPNKFRIFILLSLFVMVSWVHAEPAPSSDDVTYLIATNELLGQLNQARQTLSDSASDLIDTAIGFLGVRYHSGGMSAQTGFDCSGFVRTVYGQTVGLILPHRAEQQAAVTQHIDPTELKPGDLVFYNTMRRAFSHVGIYLGDGKFIHSPRSGYSVRVDNMSMAYWRKRFNGARRVPEAQNADADVETLPDVQP